MTNALLQQPTTEESVQAKGGSVFAWSGSIYKRFLSDTLWFGIGNLAALGLGVVQTLVIPKFLPIEGYGYWKLFSLYAVYSGLLHLGFNDGAYLRWAGWQPEEVRLEIGKALWFLLFEQFLVVGPIAAGILVLVNDPRYRFIGLMVLLQGIIWNVYILFRWSLQAVKSFRLISLFSAAMPALFLVGLSVGWLCGGLTHSKVILLYIASNLVGVIATGWILRPNVWPVSLSLSKLLRYGTAQIRIGVFVLLGNLAGDSFLTLDRLLISASLISASLPIDRFAVYSFAANILGVVNLLVTSTAGVVLPYLSGSRVRSRGDAYHMGAVLLILLWGGLSGLYLVTEGGIRAYLPQYADSLPIIRVLIGGLGFVSVIRILHGNYYKVHGEQVRYFISAFVALAILGALILLVLKAEGSLVNVAWAVVIGLAIWYLLNEVQLKGMLGLSWISIMRRLLGILGYLAALIMAYHLPSVGIKFIVYYLGFGVITMLTFFTDLRWLKQLVSVRCRPVTKLYNDAQISE